MKTLIMCQGLPGSGKTTWALDLVQADWEQQSTPTWQPHFPFTPRIIRVNQDDLRRELGWVGWDSWDFKGELEKRVHVLKRERIVDALQQPEVVTVISDDTNLSRSRKVELEQLARQYGATFEVKQFNTPLHICIKRDAARAHPVGEAVIRRMAATYYPERDAPTFAPYTVPRDIEHVAYAVICDLDGTLALLNGRSPYDASTCADDGINLPVLQVIRALRNQFIFVLFVSGREEKYRDATVSFLGRCGFATHPLYMRPTGDFRKDWIIKGEIFDAHIRSKYHVLFCLDDRNQVVDFWRSIGLTCFQVAKGDF